MILEDIHTDQKSSLMSIENEENVSTKNVVSKLFPTHARGQLLNF